jgi:hypothetical protein
MSGEVKGSISSSLRATSEISHVIDTSILVRLFGQVDFLHDTPAVFGLSLDIGSLTLD